MKKPLTILLTLAVALLAACSSSSAPLVTSPTPQAPPSAAQSGSAEGLAAVLAAPDQAGEVDSFKMDFSMTMSGLSGLGEGDQIPGVSGDSMEFAGGTAEIDVAGEKAHIVMNIMMAGEMEMIQDGTTVYMRAPFLTGFLGTDKPWVKIDGSEMSAEEFATASGGQGDPSEMLQSLRGAGSVTEVGTEVIDGVDTTHYRAEIDLAAALENVPEDQRAEAEATMSQLEEMGMTSVPTDVWIDGDGLPRRMIMAFEIDPSQMGIPSSDGGSTPITMEMVFNFSAFGEPVEISIPPASQVGEMPESALGEDLGSGEDVPSMPDMPDMPSMPEMPAT